jgi:DNA repair exonuclease SbcCD ATPase subunit
VPSSCPICEQPISATGIHCSVCGFPTALAIEGLRSVEPAAPPPEPTVLPSVPRKVHTLSPESELAARISRDLRAKMDIVHDLGRSVPDATSELCQAALSEAEGREGEALETLRGAQSRLERELDELLQQRLASVIARRDVLQAHGLRLAIGPDLDRVSEQLQLRRRDDATTLLLEVERRIGQFESDWRGLQGLLAQIQALRNQATELGLPLGEISSEIEEIRDRLASPKLTEEMLDELAQAAAQALMLLHEAVPSSLEEELARHATTLSVYPEEHVPSAVARRLHTEATRHLKKGRLPEAIQSVRELRQQVEAIQREDAARVPPPAAAPPSESEPETLDRLLKKARSLAARVRTLPPDSDAAREAAVEIRAATEHLKAREFDEADRTLARLMEMLAKRPAGGAA